MTSAEQAAEDASRRDWDLWSPTSSCPGIDGLELVRRVKAAPAADGGADPLGPQLVRVRRRRDARRRRRLPDQADRPARRCVAQGARADRAHARAPRAPAARSCWRSARIPTTSRSAIGGILLRHAAAGPPGDGADADRRRGGGTSPSAPPSRQRAAELLSAPADPRRPAGHAACQRGRAPRSTRSRRRSTRSSRPPSTPTPPATSTRTTATSTRDARRRPRSPARVLLPGASTTVEFQPTRFVAIDDFIDAQARGDPAYASQVKIRRYLDEELLRATARYWAASPQPRYVEPLEVVRDSDAAPVRGRVRAGRAPQRRADVRLSARACWSPAPAARRASRCCARWPGATVTLLGGDIDPYAAGLYLRRRGRGAPSCPAATTRGFVDELLELCAREGVDGARPDRRQRAAAAGRAPATDFAARPASRSCSRPRPDAGGLPGQVGAARALPRRACACPRPSLVDADFDPAALPRCRRSSSRARAAARAASACCRAARRARGARARRRRCWSRSTCPGPSTRSTCWPAPTGTSPAVVPRARLQGRLGDRGHRPHAARRALRGFGRDGRRARSG